MSRPKRESPSLPRPYAQLLADSEARRRAADDVLIGRMVPMRDADVRLDQGVQFEPLTAARSDKS
jgi:hypothetical protein